MNAIKLSEIIKYQYYSMPKELFNGVYNTLSLEAKMIYTLFIDRLELSKKNNWINENGEVYLVFKREDIAKKLSLTDKTVSKSIKELKNLNLVFEERRGLGKPNLIYIGKLNSEIQDTKNLQFSNQNISDSGYRKNPKQESEYFRANNTDINKTNMSDTDVSQSVESEELEKIKEKCELELLEETDLNGNVDYRKRNMVENAIELLYYSTSISVNNAIIPQEIIRKKLKLLNGAIICYAIGKIENNLKNTTNFSNSSKYIMSCLYNAINEYFSDSEIQYQIDKSAQNS